MNKMEGTDYTVKNEILVVSFGTSYPRTRRETIGAIEQSIEDTFGESFNVCRAFTSQMIINAIERKEGVKVDNVSEALDRAVQNAIRTLIVQPTHLMKGQEYDKLCKVVSGYSDLFDNVIICDPLLTSNEDFARVADSLADMDSASADRDTAVVLMGHGTAADSNAIYSRMQDVLAAMGMSNYYVGTVEAEPSLNDVLASVDSGEYRRVILRPLMVVAGNHAVNDMASADDPGSWYSKFRAAGYEVSCILEGLGQIPEIRDIYVDHIRDAAGL